MPKAVPAVERAMEFQVGLRTLRSATHPLWEAALATGSWSLMAECKALAGTLRIANTQARRIAQIADGLTGCADGIRAPGHGEAA